MKKTKSETETKLQKPYIRMGEASNLGLEEAEPVEDAFTATFGNVRAKVGVNSCATRVDICGTGGDSCDA